MKPVLAAVVACALVACAKSKVGSGPTVVAAAPMTTAVRQGDCVEARRRAAAAPDLQVDQLPTLVGGPRPFVPTPASVQADIDKRGMSFKADVLIDTLGAAVVTSLNVTETSNEWFQRNLRALLPRMKFSPAMLAGCKVARVYKFEASAPPKA